MHYDESKIKKSYVTINGQKVPLFKVPTGMSGPNISKINDEFIDTSNNDEDDDYEFNRKEHKIYDEDNIYIDNTDKFIDY